VDGLGIESPPVIFKNQKKPRPERFQVVSGNVMDKDKRRFEMTAQLLDLTAERIRVGKAATFVGWEPAEPAVDEERTKRIPNGLNQLAGSLAYLFVVASAGDSIVISTTAPGLSSTSFTLFILH
jgi:hypothetical protein